MKEWFQAARPKTLPAAIVPVWAGCVLAYGMQGRYDLSLAVWTLASAILIQVATNFFNDAIDFGKGADTDARLGPRRITASGRASGRAVMAAGGLCLAGAIACSAPLIAARGWPIVAIGIPSLYFAFGYTGGPLPLAYRGLGEIFVMLFFGLVAVAGTCFVQTGEWPTEALMLGFQVGSLSTVLIAVNNLRDIDEDRASGKNTLAVRFGLHFGRVEIATLCLAPHAVAAFWVTSGRPALALWPLVALPIGLVALWIVTQRPPGRDYNKALALSALQLVVFAAGFTVGILVP